MVLALMPLCKVGKVPETDTKLAYGSDDWRSEFFWLALACKIAVHSH